MPPSGQQPRPTAADIAGLRKLINPMLFWSDEAPLIEAARADPLLR